MDSTRCNAPHAVLCTRQRFEGDLRTTSISTRLPGYRLQKRIDLQASGIGDPWFVERGRIDRRLMGGYRINFCDFRVERLGQP